MTEHSDFPGMICKIEELVLRGYMASTIPSFYSLMWTGKIIHMTEIIILEKWILGFGMKSYILPVNSDT